MNNSEIINDGSSVKLKYGIRDGKVIDINELSKDEKGLKCNCYCPSCKERLLARLGEIKQKHFAHLNSNCNIEIAHQTALHMMAKEIIEEEKIIKFPKVSFNFEETDLFENNLDIIEEMSTEELESIPKEIIIHEEVEVEFDEVILEKRVSEIIPDIIVKTKGKECLIEIAVTHFVDKNKLDVIKEIGLPVLEIDISEFKNVDINKQSLKKILINETNNKKWVYNQLIENKKELFNKKFQPIFDNKKLELEEREIEWRNQQEKRKRAYLRKQESKNKGKAELQLAFEPARYKTLITKLKDNTKAKEVYSKSTMYRDFNKMPFYLNIPITGEFIFNCDRRIWQTLIFDKFVYCRKTATNLYNDISFHKIISYIKKHQKIFSINWQYSYKTMVNGKEKQLLNDVIDRYLHYLDALGFIEYNDYIFKKEGVVLAPSTIMPPNIEYARMLKEVLMKIDDTSLNVDADIDAGFYHIYDN